MELSTRLITCRSEFLSWFPVPLALVCIDLICCVTSNNWIDCCSCATRHRHNSIDVDDIDDDDFLFSLFTQSPPHHHHHRHRHVCTCLLTKLVTAASHRVREKKEDEKKRIH